MPRKPSNPITEAKLNQALAKIRKGKPETQRMITDGLIADCGKTGITWLVSYNIKQGEKLSQRTKKIGIYKPDATLLDTFSFPHLSFQEAQLKALEYRVDAFKGRDSSLDRELEIIRRSEGHLFDYVADKWRSQYLADKKPKTISRINGHFKNYLFNPLASRFYRKPINQVSRTDVISLLDYARDNLTSTDTALDLQGYLKAIFKYARLNGYAEDTTDPLKDLEGYISQPVHNHAPRCETPQELALLLATMDSAKDIKPIIKDYWKMCLYMMVRPSSETLTLKWSDVDLEALNPTVTIRAENIKTNEKNKATVVDFETRVPAQAVAILERLAKTRSSDWLFSLTDGKHISNNTLSDNLNRIGYTSEFMRPHGIRGMGQTFMIDHLGISEEVTEQLLIHAPKGANKKAYNQAQRLRIGAKALQAYADWLDQLQEVGYKLLERGYTPSTVRRLKRQEHIEFGQVLEPNPEINEQ